MPMGSGVYYVSTEKYHLPLLFIVTFKSLGQSSHLKPLHCEDMKGADVVNTFTWDQEILLQPKCYTTFCYKKMLQVENVTEK